MSKAMLEKAFFVMAANLFLEIGEQTCNTQGIRRKGE